MADSAAGGRRRNLGCAIAASLALHGLALSPILWQGWVDARLAQGEASRSNLFVTLQLREAVPLPSLKVAPAEVGALDKIADSAPSFARFPEKSIHEPPVDVREVIVPDAPDQGARAPDSLQKAEYLPRSALSSPALPLREIRIPWPQGLPTIGLRSAVFTLFIDEAGVVQDMVPDGHTLTPVMEEVAKRTFLATPFRPAWADGRPVKSMMRIEVLFEYGVRPRGGGGAEVIERNVLQ